MFVAAPLRGAARKKLGSITMKKGLVVAVCAGCLALGVGIGVFARSKAESYPGMAVMTGKSAKEAGLAALQEAEMLAGHGSWELLGVARVYYLSGDKAKGQEIIDRVNSSKPENSDLQRIGQIYAEAGENAKAEGYFDRALANDPKDDTGRAEVGAWYIRQGQRSKGEELFSQAFAKHPDEVWHYLKAAEAFLGVPPQK
jgi:tetratricopeptide (TPR) repeat protein